MPKTIISLKDVSKNYKMKKNSLEVLKKITIDFELGHFYLIKGHSGSGKSTLINILGLMDLSFDGEYKLNGQNVKKINSNEQANLRKDYIGFIFQDFFLDDHLKAYENVILPMLINPNIKPYERQDRAIELLKKVGLESRINHYPNELSGGEKQRVAIARALANNPSLILADEPTGNLDEENEINICNILKSLSDEGKCVIVVSHSNELLKYANKVYKLRNGNVEEEMR